MMSALLLLEIIQFRPQGYQKYHQIKKTSNKSCLEFHFVQRSTWAHIFIPPPPQWSYGARKIDMVVEIFKYYIIYIVIVLKWNVKLVKLDAIYARMQPKICIASKKRKIASTKSCLDLNFVEKKVREFCTKKSASAYVYTPLPLQVELRGLKYWYGWNIYIVQKCQITP